MTSAGGEASQEDLPVIVVGGGISGVACARVLADAGIAVRLLDRGMRLGGRMAVRTVDTASGRHAVDVGASYFTVHDAGFAAVVHRWRERGLAREWTNTFHLAGPDGLAGTTTGPWRWAGTRGLRALVEDLADGLEVSTGQDVEEVGQDPAGRPTVDGEPAAAVVLAMPDPQAADLLSEPLRESMQPAPAGGRWERQTWAPTICVWAAWSGRWWPPVDGVFVTDDPVLTWVADDGRRRGDDAPVLVAHTGPVLAAGHLDSPTSVVSLVLAHLGVVLGRGAGKPLTVPHPELVRAHRWSLASPLHPRPEPFLLGAHGVGLCGDGWGGKPRVEQAWLSGSRLGSELVRRLRPDGQRRPRTCHAAGCTVQHRDR